MSAVITRWLAALLLGLLASAPANSATPEDEIALPDQTLLPRFPGAWLVDGQEVEGGLQTLALGPVERKRREVRIGDSRTFQGAVSVRTYQLPRSVTLDKLEAHYAQLLSGQILYQCAGRDCGRSNEWANAIFSTSILYGPDADQRYFAAQFGDELVAVYLVRRGNRRVYAHHVIYRPQTPVNLAAIPDRLGDLRRLGRYRVPQLWPAPDGSLTDAERQSLQALGMRLVALEVPALYVVCHLYARDRLPAPETRRSRQPELRDDSAAVAALVTASQKCAQTAADALSQPGGPRLEAFGAGPLAPSGVGDVSRLVLVLPRID
jgi:hypothetical protein